MYLVKSPLLLKWYFPSLVWHQSRSEKTVYLTFDDGPIPNVTEFALNTLQQYGAKATFFCIGDNIQKHPEIFERIKNDGHGVGNHTFNHVNGWKTENKKYLDNFWKCQELTNTNLFRPPYGRIKKSQVKALATSWQLAPERHKTGDRNLKIVMWDCLSGDFDVNLAPEKCYQNVIKNIRNGSIIVFHDSLKAKERLEYALPKTLAFLARNGYACRLL